MEIFKLWTCELKIEEAGAKVMKECRKKILLMGLMAAMAVFAGC